ncbi:uncharacterized protein LOC129874898 [Solanum dulcamara]|uniref:uncharacterized protein LOC129874898 n=1 Tax=Solanum dulcamara TaxID=45834 RepID=UPI00248640E8|nr:uncharacterized protein LOC129874898 [Solanum dulcamara]
MNLFGSTSGIQQTSNSSVFGTITSSPFGSSTSFGGPVAFNAATNATSGQTHNIFPVSSTLPSNLERNMTLIVWPMNLSCGLGMSMSQTPPFLDIQELLHLVFQATHTLPPQDLIPIPLANQQYPCQGAKAYFIVHFLMYWSR